MMLIWLLCMTAPDGASTVNDGLTVHRAPTALSAGAVVEDWGAYLGPRHNATSLERPLRKAWPADGPPVVWERRTGTGYAGPAAAGDRVVLFHRVDNDDTVDCLEASTGRRVWRFTTPSGYRDRFGFNNGPRASPVIDGTRVYTHGAEGQLHCLDLATGAVQWSHNTTTTYGITSTYFGIGATPLILGDLLIVTPGAPGPGAVAYDKRTGAVVWSTADDWAASYASPIPAIVHGQPRVVIFAGGDTNPPTGGLLTIDPSNGRSLCRVPWRAKKYESVNAASPVVIGDQVFITAAYRTGGMLVDLAADGTCRPSWTTRALGAHWGTPIHRNGCLYGFDGDGGADAALVCIAVDTGKELWRRQLEWPSQALQNGSPVTITTGLLRGSLLWADGHFLALGEHGDLAWLDLSPTDCRVIAHARLFRAAESFTLPVLHRGLLYVNQNMSDADNGTPERLLCIDLRGPSS